MRAEDPHHEGVAVVIAGVLGLVVTYALGWFPAAL